MIYFYLLVCVDHPKMDLQDVTNTISFVFSSIKIKESVDIAKKQ